MSSDPTTHPIYTMSIWLALHQITPLVSKEKKCSLIWIKCCGETLRKGKRSPNRQPETKCKSPTDSLFPDQNKCFSCSSVLYLVARMRSAQISCLAPKLVIFSNFHRGGPGIFSALNRIFIEEEKEKKSTTEKGITKQVISLFV